MLHVKLVVNKMLLNFDFVILLIYHNLLDSTIKIVNHLLPALCRLGIFLTHAALSSKIISHQFRRDTVEKVVFYSTSQICVVYAFSLLIYAYNAIVKTMQREKYVAVEVNAKMELGVVDEYDLDLLEDDNFTDGTSTKAKTSEAILAAGTPLDNAVVFKNSAELRQYISLTHRTGVLIFVLIVALDFSHGWMTYIFCLGLWSRCMLSSFVLSSDSFCDVLMRLWVVLFLVSSHIWLVFLVSDPLPAFKHYPLTSPLIMISLFSCGVTWAQTDGAAFERRAITDICLDAKCTVLFLSIPSLVILYRSDIFDGYAPTFKDVVFIWIVEPCIKFLCVVIFVLGVRSRRVLELVLVISITLLFQTCITDNPTRLFGYDSKIVSALLISVLFGVYIVRSVTVLSLSKAPSPAESDTNCEQCAVSSAGANLDN